MRSTVVVILSNTSTTTQWFSHTFKSKLQRCKKMPSSSVRPIFQVFLPFPNLLHGVQCLHNYDLILSKHNANLLLCPFSDQFATHPLTLMWKDYHPFLFIYTQLTHTELRSRGFESEPPRQQHQHNPEPETPWWFTLPAIHNSHQSSLTARNPSWYRAFWQTPPNLPTFWPVTKQHVMTPF